MSFQPSPPQAPAAPSILSAQDRADVAQSVRGDNAVGRQAQGAVAQAMAQARGEMAQARRDMAQGAVGQASSVVKDGTGRIVVTGPDGKTITIDPKVGLDGDQIQEMVQTALQPTRFELRRNEGPGPGAVMIVAIVFSFLFLIALVIARAVRRRPLPAGASTAVLPPETVARLARIEQAVEAVAIEVERISEAQRYSAQLLTDRLAAPNATMPAVAAAARVNHE